MHLLTFIVFFFYSLNSLASTNIIGNKNAPITVEEYSSYTCHHCAEFHNEHFPEIYKKFIKTGKVKFIHHPVFHPQDKLSMQVSMIPFCNGDRYLSYMKTFMATQKNWLFETNKHLETIKDLSLVGGMTPEKISACLANKPLEKKILEDQLHSMNKLNIKATPTFFINGQKIDGYMTAKQFAKMIYDIENGRS